MPRRSVVRAASLLVLAACDGGGGGIKVYNTNPNASITYPDDGGTLDAGVSVTLAGTGSDPESPETDLLGTWSVDGEVLCDSVPLDIEGRTECTTVFEAGSFTVGLTVIDPSGGSSTVTHSIVVLPSNAPTVEIVAPVATGFYYADRNSTLEGLVADEEDSNEELSIAWSSDLQGDLGLPASADSRGVTTGEVVLDEGTHDITLTATDTDGLQGSATVSIVVMGTNEPPSCGITAPVDGSNADAGTEVTFEGIASDPNVDSQYLTAAWESDRDGILISEPVSSSGDTAYTTDSLTVGTHAITLTVTDDAGEVCTDSLLYTVGTPPTVSIDAPFDGDVVNEGDLVSFMGTATDSEDVGLDLEVAWTSSLDGTLDTQPPPGDGSGSLSFVTDELAAGTHDIRLRVTDSDGLYTDDTISLVVNGLPGAPAIDINPDPAYTGSDLVVSITADAVDPEGTSVSYGYDWTVDGVAAGITSDTVPASATSRGELWEVTVTPFDGYGTGTPATASVTIDNALPTVDAAPTLSPDPAYEGDTLTCAPGVMSDADGDAVTASYSWQVNGAAVAATSATLGSTFFDAGDTVACFQTPNDAYGSGLAVSSNVVTIANSVPEVSNVDLSPDPADAGDTLTCTYSFSDADGDSDASTIAWSINGSSTGTTGATLSSGYVRGDTVTCSVTPGDGTDTGSVETASIVISNSRPEISSVSLSPDPADTDDTLSCTVGTVTDVDGDTVTYTYAWYVNGSSVGVSATSLPTIYTTKNDTVYCLVTPNDSYESGTAVQSNVVTIDNSAPVMSTVTLSPSSPGTEDIITATATATDADSDTVSYSYDWYVGGSYAVTTASNTLSGLVYFDRGDTVEVEVTPTDGTDFGSPLSSSAVTVANTLPEAPVLGFSPSEPEQGIDDIVCDVDTAAYDADGDTVSYSFSWTVDGAAFTGTATTTTYTGDTIAAADTVDGFDWVCSATPNDGYGNGTTGSAAVTVVDVTDPGAPTVDTPTRYRNEDSVTITGECDYGDCVDVVVEYVSSSSSGSTTVSCGSGDSYSASFSGLTRGETTLFNAYCVDAAGNESGSSNTGATDVCSPEDVNEDSIGTGDAAADAVEPFTVVDDGGGTTYTESANILGTDTVDWYVIDSSDQGSDSSVGLNYYSFDVRLLEAGTTAESSDYTMTVYKGSATATECSGGYTAYTDYVYDRGDGSHTPPADRRRCSTVGVSNRNECEDMGTTYYVKVERVSGVTDCTGYTLSVTNGDFVCDSSECPY